MASRYRVSIAEAAREDLREVARYITRRDSAAAARRQLAKLRTRLQALTTNPTRGRIPPELEERGIHTWREVVVAPWRVLYRIDAREVYVLVVVDGRRDLAETLLRRLTRVR